jgi:hydroxyacylglutathione hydrolase
MNPVLQFEIGDYQNLVYLLIDWPSRQALIVDPQSDLSPLLETFKKHSLTPTGILLTHTHWDHIAGVPELTRLYPGIAVHVGERDAHRLKAKLPEENLRFLSDEQILKLGSLAIRVLQTPGHSPGECSYFIDGTPPYLLTGDTVFIRDCGRTDLEGGSNDELFSSLQKIKALPAETKIMPGHSYNARLIKARGPEIHSTLADEMRESAPFRCRSVEELASLP